MKKAFLKLEKKGMALGLALVTIAIGTLIFVTALRTSMNSKAAVEGEANRRQLRSQAIDRFYAIKNDLTQEVNSWIAARQAFLANSNEVAAAAAVSITLPSSVVNVVVHNAIATGKLPARLESAQFVRTQDPNSVLTVKCILNCNTEVRYPDNSSAYPKSFYIRLTQYLNSTKHDLILISGTVEINRTRLADFSALTLAAQSQEVRLGAQEQAKIGIFFGGGIQNGVVRFMNPTGTTISARQLVTNATLNNVISGVDYLDGQNSHIHTSVGPIDIPGGILTGQSPGVDIGNNFQALISDPGTIKSGDPNVVSAQVKLGQCSGLTCKYSLKEYDSGNNLLHDTGYVNIPNSQAVYTTATNVSVDSADGTNQAQFGSGALTLIASGSFHLKSSVSYVGGDPNSKGRIAFVSLNNNAVIIDGDAKSLIGSSRMSDLMSNNNIKTQNTFNFDAGAITACAPTLQTCKNNKAISLDNTLLSGANQGGIGQLSTDGPIWSTDQMTYRMTDNSGAVLYGFNSVSSKYSDNWLSSPPPGMNIESSISHNSRVSGLSIRQQSIAEALSKMNLAWAPNPNGTSSTHNVEASPSP